MTADPRIPQLFHDALELEGEAREVFLAKACGDDRELRHLLDELLICEAETFDEELGLATAQNLVAGLDSAALPRIPGYQLFECIGRGGMGAVYRASSESSGEDIAVKVLTNPLSTPEIRRRFEYEADILGFLEHPGIAALYKVGTFESEFGAQPYYAMEFIEGCDMVEYTRAHQFSPQQSLEMLAQVCDSVHFVHQKGVVHRDLKPANILVADDGIPRVMDFGIARATHADLARTTRDYHTRTGDIVGTVGYMSPEQAAGRATEVDARSDVYALGVLGYELLTGNLPHPAEGDLPNVLRSIIQDPPPSLGATKREFGGDLETIFSKALSKEPQRRYASTAELGAEIRRYLNDEPIIARRSSKWYRATRFAKRNRQFVTATVLVFVLLVLGLAGTTHGRWLANQRLVVAEQRALEADRAIELMEGIFAAVQGQGRQARLADALDAGIPALLMDLEEVPRVEARVRFLVGTGYLNIGDFPKAREQFSTALQQVPIGRDNDRLRWRIARSYSIALRELGLHDESVTQLDGALRQQRAVAEPDNDEILKTRRQLALSWSSKGEFTKAIKELEELREGYLVTPGVSKKAIQEATLDLGQFYQFQGDETQAQSLFEELVGPTGARGPIDSRLTQSAVLGLAQVLVGAGKFEAASGLLSEILSPARSAMGETHPHYLAMLHCLAQAYVGLGRPSEAEALVTETIEGIEQRLGNRHPSYFLTLSLQGQMQWAAGNWLAANETHRIVYEGQLASLGQEHPDVVTARIQLGMSLMQLGRAESAKQHLREALDQAHTLFAPEKNFITAATACLASLLVREGRVQEGIELCEELLSQVEPLLPSHHEIVRRLQLALASMQTHAGKLDLAAELYESVLPGLRASRGGGHPDLVVTFGDLGRVYVGLGRLEDAVRIINEGIALVPAEFGPDHPLTRRMKASLGVAYRDLERFEEAAALFLEVIKPLADGSAPVDPTTTAYRRELGLVYLLAKQYEEAREQLESCLRMVAAGRGPKHPHTLRLQTLIAQIDLFTGSWAEAETRLRMILDAGGSPAANRILALVLLRMGKSTEAEKICRAILVNRKPDSQRGLGYRAIAFFILADIHEGRADLEEAKTQRHLYGSILKKLDLRTRKSVFRLLISALGEGKAEQIRISPEGF